MSLYWALQAFLAAGDLTQPGTYAQAATFLDIPNYIDFKLLEIHAYRWDIGGNQRMWRPHTPEGRFRWLQYDNDVAYGGFGASEPAWEFNMLAADVTPDGSLNGHNDETRVFTLRQLLTLPEFRRDFINRYADLLNTLLRPAHLIDRVDALAGVLAPEMEEHIRRWIEPASMDEWHNHVQHLRDYASRRPEFARQQVMQQFGLSGVATLSLSVSDTNRGTLRINTLSISAPAPSPWTGVYFKDNPISVTAVPNPGYWLAGWRGTSGADPANGTATNLTLRLTGDLALQALFEPDPTLLPSIGRFSRTPQGDLELSVQGVPRQAYDVQSSTDLAIWLPIQSVVIGPAGAAEVIVTDPGNTKARFYRLWKR